jgi:hypothetical protein
VSTFIDQMQALAADVNAVEGDVFATVDLVAAVDRRPCVYVAPPILDYAAATLLGRPLVRHTLVALSSRDAEDVEALAELVALIDAVTTAVPEIESAEPAAYALTADLTVPAYLLTLTR